VLHDEVEHGIGLAHPKMLSLGYADHLGLGDGGEPPARLVRAQVVVVLGHNCHDRLAGRRPAREIGISGGLQRGREQHDPDDRRLIPISQGQVGPEGPADEPALREPRELDVLDRGRNVEPLPGAVVEDAFAGALDACGAAGVEADDGQPRQRNLSIVTTAPVGGECTYWSYLAVSMEIACSRSAPSVITRAEPSTRTHHSADQSSA